MARGGKARNRDLAAVALASGKTVAEAAAAASVDERTVYNWLTEPDFTAHVAELRSAAVREAVNKLAAQMSASVDVLAGLLASTSETTRRLTAVAILELALKGIEQEVLKRELEELRAAIEGKTSKRGG
jgi:hypothetical protein